MWRFPPEMQESLFWSTPGTDGLNLEPALHGLDEPIQGPVALLLHGFTQPAFGAGHCERPDTLFDGFFALFYCWPQATHKDLARTQLLLTYTNGEFTLSEVAQPQRNAIGIVVRWW